MLARATIVFNANGTITITPAPDDFVSGVEGVVGSAGNDTIIGNAANNFLVGGPGDDNITGNSGNDCVIGGTGNDILNENNVSLAADGYAVSADTARLGNGADALDGGPGPDDMIDYSACARTARWSTWAHQLVQRRCRPELRRDLQRVRRRVLQRPRTRSSGAGNDILSADF